MMMSDSENSETEHEQGSVKSPEDTSSEHEKVQQRKNNKKSCGKRKHMKKVVSDSESSSSEDGETEQVSRPSKKRRKTSSDQILDHGEVKKKTEISSGDETEEKSPPNINRMLGSKAEESDSDDDTPISQYKSIKNEEERENGYKNQEISEQEDSRDHPESPRSQQCSPGGKSVNKQKTLKQTVQHSSDSSDDASDTNERNISAVQKKKSQSGGTSSSELSDTPETTEGKKLKYDGKAIKNKTEKQAEKEENSSDSSSSDQPLSKYSDNKQKHLNLQHSSPDSSDNASETDVKTKSSSKKRSQSDADSSSKSSSSIPSDMDKKGKSAQKKAKSKTKKDSGNTDKTNPKIERLKKYLRVAGLRVRSYEKLWEGCRTNKSKTEKLLQMLSDAGLKGKPTLQKCKKLQAKRERKEEVASLDVGNIITSEKGRPKRNTPSLYLGRHPADVKKDSPKKKGANTFSRIMNIVDSEESE